eukprot:m.10704 g.10704  ORF g.10704 m.10704 type:complete len:78 (+) comp7797_c0_seq1:977-1210(+)
MVEKETDVALMVDVMVDKLDVVVGGTEHNGPENPSLHSHSSKSLRYRLGPQSVSKNAAGADMETLRMPIPTERASLI